MIQIIFGKRGSGKTKRIIDMANASIRESKGDVLFIDDDNRYMFDLKHQIRFVNASEYGAVSYTHLDVYKRQTLRPARPHRCACAYRHVGGFAGL